MAKDSETIVIDYGDVKRKFLATVERGEGWSSQPMDHYCRQMHRDPYKKNDGWSGGTGADTLKYIREGYFAPEFAHSAEYVPRGEKIRNVWNDEEGDVDAGRLLAGNDDFFLGSQKRPHRPGLRVQIEFAFAWTVSSKTIQEYGAWVAGFLASLEQTGFDLVVDMWIPLDELFQYARGRTNVLMRVKRHNEVSDFTEWSALFGPTGYRHLGFTAKCVAGDKVGKRVSDYFGMTIGGKSWGLEYDREQSLVSITCNQRAGGGERFPFEALNKKAIAEGLLPDANLSLTS